MRFRFADLAPLLILCALALAAPAAAQSPYFEVQVLDDATSRGVPLVELEMTNSVRYVTDSAGRAAILEPGLEGQRVFFKVTSHGYEFPKDGFGYPGFAAELRAGEKKVVRIKRVNVAERLYRITGGGIYRDSVMLGHSAPIRQPLLNARVFGQDSVLALPYQGRLYWFWGDTSRPAYPLGHFRTAGATSGLPSQGGLDPAVGVDLDYFADQDGFSRPMVPLPEEKSGPIWVGGLAVVPDASGRELMVGAYSRMQNLGTKLEQGLMKYNDKLGVFERVKKIDLTEKWRFPDGHPLKVSEGGVDHLLFPRPFPTVRVKAAWEAIQDPAAYEAFTCLKPGTKYEKGKSQVERDAAGAPVWGWKKDAAPLTQPEEADLVKSGLLKKDEARFQLCDAATSKTVTLHGGSVYWNDYLKSYVLIGLEIYGASMLGEVWFARAAAPTGPWRKAVKVVTHDKYSFYNPTQHPFFDQEGGRLIYFEGTYANTFSGNTYATPRYDYNQVMYRLDLADPRLKPALE